MTRDDSDGGSLFAGVPTDFFCLNRDDDADSNPDYLDSFDSEVYSADTYCPFDPTDPPVTGHLVSGTVFVATLSTLDLDNFQLVTSDGPGNCRWASEFLAVTGGYAGIYECDVYDWGSGWTGYIQLWPNTPNIYCGVRTVAFTSVVSDETQSFSCINDNTVTIGGQLTIGHHTAVVSAIDIADVSGVGVGDCVFDNSSYECVLLYEGSSVNVELTVTSDRHVCESVDGVFSFFNYTADESPYEFDIWTERNAGFCP